MYIVSGRFFLRSFFFFANSLRRSDNLLKTAFHRSRASGLPPLEEVERFGADGEEAIYRLLSENLDTVVRNVAVPHKNLYLEKDFFIQHLGVPFVVEVKHWKGKIGCTIHEDFSDDTFGPALTERVREFLVKLIPLYDYFNLYQA